VLSTAELIGVVTGGALQGAYFGDGHASVEACVGGLIGSVMKENAADRDVLREYVETVASSRHGRDWQAFTQASREQLGA
jgi:hypothetical protein